MVAASPPAGASSAPVTEEGIRQLLGLFYGRVRRDPLLGPVFARAVGATDADWAPHLARLADFWSAVVLSSGRYRGDPFSAHLRLPDLEPAMFDRWLALFGEACAEALEPEAAALFQSRAATIARSLRMGLFERLPARAGRRREPSPAPAAGGHP